MHNAISSATECNETKGFNRGRLESSTLLEIGNSLQRGRVGPEANSYFFHGPYDVDFKSNGTLKISR